MLLKKLAQRFQGIDQKMPTRWRLPFRYAAQSLLGALEPEIPLLPGFLGDCIHDGVALDIGANVGIYTYALHQFGMDVHAFEPQPACAKVLSAWAQGKNGITVHNSGVGSTEGNLTLHIPMVDGKPIPTRASFLPTGQDEQQLSVPVVRIDSSSFDKVSFIKIDVEGHEIEVLRGAANTIERFRPKLLVEIDRNRHNRESFEEIIDLLRRKGYRCYTILGDGKLGESSVPWDAPQHIYNFLFSA